MKLFLLSLIALSFSYSSFAQPNTEVYLFDLIESENGYSLSNPVNISNNPGYDNQPSFSADGSKILFSSTRDGNTDIVLYDIASKSKTWISNTPDGGEYSPKFSPNGDFISAVQLEDDGTQLLWKYYLNEDKPEILAEDLKVGYYDWMNENMLVAFVLDQPNRLFKTDLENLSLTQVIENPGRSVHRIPDTQLFSFVDKNDPENWLIKKGNLLSNRTETITNTLYKIEDLAWINSSMIVMGMGNELYFYDTSEVGNWTKIVDLKSEFNLEGVTRIAVSSNGDKIAVVVNF